MPYLRPETELTAMRRAVGLSQERMVALIACRSLAGIYGFEHGRTELTPEQLVAFAAAVGREPVEVHAAWTAQRARYQRQLAEEGSWRRRWPPEAAHHGCKGKQQTPGVRGSGRAGGQPGGD